MAKRKTKPNAEPKAKKVVFDRPFDGCLNNFYIKANAGDKMELPPNVYDWIQKFGVVKDA